MREWAAWFICVIPCDTQNYILILSFFHSFVRWLVKTSPKPPMPFSCCGWLMDNKIVYGTTATCSIIIFFTTAYWILIWFWKHPSEYALWRQMVIAQVLSSVNCELWIFTAVFFCFFRRKMRFLHESEQREESWKKYPIWVHAGSENDAFTARDDRTEYMKWCKHFV